MPAANPAIDYCDPTVRSRALAMLQGELAELRLRVAFEARRSLDLPALARLRELVHEELARYERFAAAVDPRWNADWFRDEAAELTTAADALSTATRILAGRAVNPLGPARSIEARFVMLTSSRFDDDLIAQALYPGIDRASALERVRQHRSTSRRRRRHGNDG